VSAAAREAGRLTGIAGGPFGFSAGVGLVIVLLTVLLAAGVAFVIAQLGVKSQLLVAGAIVVLAGVLAIREKPLFVLVVLALSVQFLFRKSFGPISETATSGPPSVYLTSVDVILVILYAWWGLERTLLTDLRGVLGRPIFIVPLVGSLAVLPSLFVATNASLVLGELTRVFFSFALFVYVACRVHTRRETAVVLGALALVALTQCTIAALQARTGSTLGLEVLGSGTEADIQAAAREQSLGDTSGGIARPPGTVLHAVLLGSLMCMISMAIFGLALHLKGMWARLACLAIVGAGLGAIVLALARAPAFGVAISAPLAVVVALRRGRLPWRAVWLVIAGGLVGLAVFWAPVSRIVSQNIGTDHFWAEVDVRLELNAVAIDMINSSPLVGIGLNQSEEVLDSFEPYGVQYPGYPAHNLYLLVTSETGIIGLLGLLAMLAALFLPGLRLMRLNDRFLSGVGAGTTAMLIAVCMQELLVFSLRFDVTRTVFWMLTGLCVACWRLASREGLFSGPEATARAT
jgi:putative inorganic carbon (hco3(-)) transporter